MRTRFYLEENMMRYEREYADVNAPYYQTEAVKIEIYNADRKPVLDPVIDKHDLTFSASIKN